MKNIKLILLGFVVFVLGMGFVYYLASTKISTNKISDSLNKMVREAIPKANVKYSKLDYNIGPSIKFYVENIFIHVEGNSKPILHIAQAKARVSLVAIIAGHGDVNIDIEDVIVDEELLIESLTQNELKVLIPKFIVNDRINLKIKNIKRSEAGEIALENRIDRFLVKNFNFKKSSAFEMDLPIRSKLLGNLITADLQLIGEFNLNNYLNNNDFKSSFVANVTNFQTNNQSYKIPDIKDDIALRITDKGIMTIDHLIKVGGVGVMSFKSRSEKNKLHIDDFKSTFELDKYNEIFNKTPIIFKALSLDHVSLDVAGNMTIDNLSNKIVNNLEFNLTKPIKVSSFLGKGIEIVGAGTFVDDFLKIKLQGQMYNGTFVSDINSKINLYDIYENKDSKKEWKIKFNCSGLQILPDELYKQIYRDEIKVSDEEKNVLLKERKILNEHVVNVGVSCDNIFIGKNESSFHVDMNYKSDRLEVEKLVLKSKKGELFGNFAIHFSDIESGYYHLKLNKIEVDELSKLLPKNIGQISGIATGTINGNYRKVDPRVIHAEVNLDIQNPWLQIINYAETQASIYDAYENYFLEEMPKPTPILNKINMRFKLDQEKVRVENLQLIEIEKRSSLKLSGQIHTGVENGSVFSGEYEDFILGKIVKLKKIPIKFSGTDLSIGLDPEWKVKVKNNAPIKKNEKI